MRYEFSDFEWAAIKPLLPNKSRGVQRVNDRRVLNGIFWVLRSGAPWRDLPVCYGHAPPATTVSSGGEGPEYGAGSWTHLPPLTEAVRRIATTSRSRAISRSRCHADQRYGGEVSLVPATHDAAVQLIDASVCVISTISQQH